jgi:signal transduction histidine kinase
MMRVGGFFSTLLAGRGGRLRLFALFAATTLPILLFAIGTAFVVDREYRLALERSIRAVARTAIGAVDQVIDGRISDLEVLAATLRFDAGDAETLGTLLRSQTDWLSISIFDATPGGAVQHFRRPETPAALHAPQPEDLAQVVRQRKPLVTGIEPRRSPTIDPAIVLIAPVQRGEQVTHLLVLRLASHAASDLVAAQGFDPSWTVGVLDRQRWIAARNRAHDEFVGTVATPTLVQQIERATDGFFIALNKEGKRVYTAVRTSERSGWTAAVGVPAEEIEQPVHQARLVMAGSGAAALLLTGLLSGVLITSQVRRQQAERRLGAMEAARALEQRLTDIAAHLPGVIFRQVLSPDGRLAFPFLSDGAERLLRSPPDRLSEPMPLDWVEALFHPDDRRAWREATAVSARTLAPLTVDVRTAPVDSTVHWLSMLAHPSRSADGSVLWDGVMLDITEHKRRDQTLIQAQKMESVGQLTGGVAHDFNNLLTVILGCGDQLVDLLADQPQAKHLAAMTVSAAQRAASLTKQLLAFSRRQVLQPTTVDVNALLHGMNDLLHRTLGEQVEIALVLDSTIAEAIVDPVQLETSVLNLSINARDAMPRGGKLTIETANVVLDEDYAQQEREVRPGAYVMLAVTDSGEGMPATVAERAFEPFFTTKEVGKGSGLGLSMVYGFVKQTGGHIKLYSEIGQGTTVKLYLPRSARPGAAAAVVPPAATQRGSETVLVVEDDPLVCELVTRQLGELGYQVLLANDAPTALVELRRGQRIDLLFTDVVLPRGMNGRELAEVAMAERPGLKVLYTSGYTANAIVRQGRLKAGVSLLQKPYTRQQLSATIRAVLDQR